MKIAMTISGGNEILVPIVEGDFIRLFDTINLVVCEDFANPALQLQNGKRGAVPIRWLNARKVNLLCTPPSMLCELSYEAAQKGGF